MTSNINLIQIDGSNGETQSIALELAFGIEMETDVEVEAGPKQKAGTSGKGKGKKRLRSMVWDHVVKVENVESPTVVCKYCKKEFPCDSAKNGTGQMRHHLMFKCPNAPENIKEIDPKQKFLSQTIDGMFVVSYDGDLCRSALTEMVIIDDLPFKTVEGEGFLRFCEAMQPRFSVPSRSTITRDAMKLYEDYKLKLRNILSCERICLTTDTWSSIQNVNYMCLTAHYIDKSWVYQKKILNFCIVESHKGAVIGKAVENCLQQWGIKRLFTITIDNASSNNGAIAHLKKKTRGWEDCILDNEFMHMRCCAHILNLVVSDGLKESCDLIEKIRNAVKFVRSSPARLTSFKNNVSKACITTKSMLCLDVSTRWNSTYLMLESAVKLQKAFEILEEDDVTFTMYFKDDERLGPLDSNDFVIAGDLVKFLRLFYEATIKFSRSSFATANACYHELSIIENKMNMLSISEDLILSNMARGMKRKFHKYWGNIERTNLLLYVATMLDPRRKMRYIRFCFNRLRDANVASVMVVNVKIALVRLYKWFEEHAPVQKERIGSGSNGLDACMLDPISDGDALEEEFKREMLIETNAASDLELDIYLDDSCLESHKNFDVLGWWKMKSSKFPVLAEVARHVLAVLVSTVASESTFSTGGRILDAFRSSLAPATVEALICSQNWIKTSRRRSAMKKEIDMTTTVEELDNDLTYIVKIDGS